MSRLDGFSPRRMGCGRSVYFSSDELPVIDTIEQKIRDREIRNFEGYPFRSFSDFLREAMFFYGQHTGALKDMAKDGGHA